MKLALCVIGCGQFAQVFSQAMQPLREDIDLMFASRDAAKAREYSERFQGIRSYGSYADAFADPRVEAVYIATPHHLHCEHVTSAARKGKHILVEKPIGRNLEEARTIIAEARRGRITLMVAENFRFMNVARRCKELVDDGVIGDLRLIQMQEEAPFIPGGWRSSRQLSGGGVFIDGGIHKVHFLRYLAGEPDSVYASSLPHGLSGYQGEDGMAVMYHWQSGAVGLINHSWTNSRRPQAPWVSINGTRGRVYFEVGSPWMRVEKGNSEQTLQLGEDQAGLTAMAQEFHDSIRQQRTPEVSGSEGLKDLTLVLKAYESMNAGVSLPLGD
ncbi:MAG: Gfo/Idh/MocA family protein [Dehalococcoidia bacterium]